MTTLKGREREEGEGKEESCPEGEGGGKLGV